MIDNICHFCNSAIDPITEWGLIVLNPNKENLVPIKIRLCEDCFRKYSFSLVSKLRVNIKLGSLR